MTWPTKAAEEPVMTTESDVVGLPVNAELSNPIKPGKRRGLLGSLQTVALEQSPPKN